MDACAITTKCVRNGDDVPVTLREFRSLLDLNLNWYTTSVNLHTSFQTCAVSAASFVGLLPPANKDRTQLWRSKRYWKRFKVIFMVICVKKYLFANGFATSSKIGNIC